MEDRQYESIVRFLEGRMDTYGDSHLAMHWPNAEDAVRRYQVMLDLIPPGGDRPVELLDFGCGLAHMYEHIQSRGLQGIRYSGLDLSQKFVDAARAKHPEIQFYCMDVLDGTDPLPDFDYAVINGIFTYKHAVSHADMAAFLWRLLRAVYPKVRRGLAFNVMSKHVDWERDDLFHLPFDEVAAFVRRELSRWFVFRQDYGLYEYTTYVYRNPNP